MIQIVLRAPDGRFVGQRGTDAQLRAIHAQAGPAEEILVENVDRPAGDLLQAGDRLVLRSARNAAWCVRSEGIDRTRADVLAPVLLGQRHAEGQVFRVLEAEQQDKAALIRLGVEIDVYVLAAGSGLSGLGEIDPYRLVDSRVIVLDGEGSLMSLQGPTSTATLFEARPRSIKVFLRAPARRLMRESADDGTLRIDAASPAVDSVFTVVPVGSPFSRRLYDGDPLVLVSPTGAYLSAAGAAVGAALGTGAEPTMFMVARQDGAGEVVDGDPVRLNEVAFFESPRSLTFSGDRPVLVRGPGLTDASLALDLHVDLVHWFSAAASDHTLRAGHKPPERTGYERVRAEGRMALGPLPGTVPLKRYWSGIATDEYVTATEAGESETLRGVPSATFQGVEGFIWDAAQPGTIPLNSYLQLGTVDHFNAATRESERAIDPARFRFRWIEGHVVAPRSEAAAPWTPAAGAVPKVPLPGGRRGIVTRQPALGTVRVEPGLLAPQPRRTRRALVLSGGGAKGAFEVGAIRELYARGYHPDLICGVSVGALNTIKLAEGKADSATELEHLWREHVAVPGRIFRKEHYVTLLGKLVDRLVERAKDTGLAAILSTIAGASLLGPAGSLVGTFTGTVAGAEANDLDGQAIRILNVLLTLAHSLHSMEPLRKLIAGTLTDDTLSRMATSPVAMRLGITTMGTGQYFTVGSPEPGWQGELARCGPLFPEADHQPGESWLTRPIFGADDWVMPLAEAVYASCTLPVYMDPYLVDLGESDVIASDGFRHARLRPRLPTALRRFLDASGLGAVEVPPERLNMEAVEHAIDDIVAEFAIPDGEHLRRESRESADGIRGNASRHHFLFDGGLRDTLPLRTALRLGATEVTVISCDAVHRAQHRYVQSFRAPQAGPLAIVSGSPFNGLNFGATPLAQHLKGMLGMWFNEVARADMFTAVAMNELKNLLHRATRDLESAARDRLMNDFEDHWAALAPRLNEALGAGTWVGGRRLEDWNALGQGATIRYIAPDRDVIDPLDFENAAAVEEAITLGARAARAPVQLSAP